MELRLAVPAPGPALSKLLHRIPFLHSRLCSFVASVFFLLWMSCLLYFHSSSSLRNVSQPPSNTATADQEATSDHIIEAAKLDLGLRNRAHDQGALLATSSAGVRALYRHVLPSALSSPPLDFAPHPRLLKPWPASSSTPKSSLPITTASTVSITWTPSASSSTPSFQPSSSSSTPQPSNLSIKVPSSRLLHQSCAGKYVYMHSLPPMFNQDMISNCTHHSPTWADFCSLTSNEGLGPILQDRDGVLTPPDNGVYSWYNTDQFILDVILHSRMKNYACLTPNSSKADLIYVPFYAGLDITKHLWGANVSEKDRLPTALADWLIEQPEWRSMQGRDHFFVTGKISWDFRRPQTEENGWGNSLLELPALKDVSVLLIEKGPAKAYHVEHAIPYPTYFHPHKDSEVFDWQNRMRARKRVNLFAFAGASRPELEHSIRGELIEQCRISTFCKLLECTRYKSGCNSPTTVMKLFQESVFCLQPTGDSYTRRSVFDSMVSGCIPVLFHPHTVYTEYTWHLPKNFSTYSVFIPEEDIKAKTVVIERILQRIPASQIKDMREKVISLLPTLIYAHPDNKLEKVKDAFDVAMEALLKKVSPLKREKMPATQEFS